MCGIAGIVNLKAAALVDADVVRRMADALVHRGPDEDGFLDRPGLGLASRRLSIIGLLDGRQPIASENWDVCVVYNAELFDDPEARQERDGRGCRFTTHRDRALSPHLWE